MKVTDLDTDTAAVGTTQSAVLNRTIVADVPRPSWINTKEVAHPVRGVHPLSFERDFLLKLFTQ